MAKWKRAEDGQEMGIVPVPVGPIGQESKEPPRAGVRWTEGPIWVQLSITDDPPPSNFRVVGWTKSPINLWILISAGVKILWINKRIDIAFWLKKI